MVTYNTPPHKRIRYKMILAITVVCLLSAKSDKVGRNQNCENHNQCQSKKCIPMCNDSSKKKCIMASWFYQRHGLEIPKCVLDEDEHSHIYFRRKVGETCHNDANCETKHCVEACSSKKMICLEPKLTYQERKINIPKCVEEKTIDLVEKPRSVVEKKIEVVKPEKVKEIVENREQKMDEKTIDLVEKPRSVVEKKIEVVEPEKVKEIVENREKKMEVVEKTQVTGEKKIDIVEKSIEPKTTLGTKHLGQQCNNNEDCITTFCMPLCGEDSSSFCVQPRWSFEMYGMHVPECLTKEKYSRLEKLVSVKVNSEPSNTKQIVLPKKGNDDLTGERRMNVNKNAPLRNDNNEKMLVGSKMETSIEKEKQKIDEGALAKLRKGEMKFPEKEPQEVEKSAIGTFINEMFSLLFGFHIVGFFFLILPLVLMLLL